MTLQARQRPAVFLDRDGVINRSLFFNGKPRAALTLAEFELLPGVVEASWRLKRAGYLQIVVTNQPDVAHGIATVEEVEKIHKKLAELLPVDRIEVCYEAADDHPCKKPNVGMLESATKALNIDTGRSWLVGDRWRDIEAGRRIGCKTILIDYNYNEKRIEPDTVTGNLSEAVDVILAKT